MRTEYADIDGLPLRWLRAPGPDPPTLYVHGVPDSADLWTPFLQAGGGIAVDLPGFGESGKPAEWPYSAAGYRRFLVRFLDYLGIDRVPVVAHDWGAVALTLGERVERAVAIGAVPLTPDYRWHRIARLWRTPVVGELAMGFTGRPTLRRPGGLDREHADAVMRHFDHGTQRAILKLHRSASPAALADAGAELGGLRAPVLVLCGERDRWVAPDGAERLAAALGGEATVEVVPGAGHWPWRDRPELVTRVHDFLRC